MFVKSVMYFYISTKLLLNSVKSFKFFEKVHRWAPFCLFYVPEIFRPFGLVWVSMAEDDPQQGGLDTELGVS